MLDHATMPVVARRPVRTALAPSLAISLVASFVAVAAVTPVVLSAPAGTRGTAVPVFAVGVSLLFGLGLSDLVRAQDSRFARAVVGAGVLWTLSALAVSSTPALYSVGRTSAWFVDVALVYLLLAYPSGRLTDSGDRRLFGAAAAIAILLYLPSVLVVAHFPAPSVWSDCVADCPQNAFALTHSAPGLLQDLIVSARELLTAAVFIAVAVVVAERARTAVPMRRGMYWPIALVAVLRVLDWAGYVPIRRGAPTSELLDVMMWAYVLSLPAVALACIAGRLNRRAVASKALDQVARGLRTGATAQQVRSTLADALVDPSLRTLYSFPRSSGEWVDESGAPAALPPTPARQDVTEVANGSWRMAIVHDPALSEDRPLVRTAASFALAMRENESLTAELSSSRNELAQSRARVAAADSARRKIERDLHDGAQQRLIALRVKLALAAERLEQLDPAGADVIRALEQDIDATIDEVRAFAHGVYPALLAQTGLGEALRSAARAASLPTTVHADRCARYPPEIEMAVYFSCSEALQNAAKHARGATCVTISVRQERELEFEVRDDGAGFDVRATGEGIGLANLHDRLAAVGGRITVRSVPGEGTCVQGSIPLV